MAQLILNIPDVHVPRILQSFKTKYSYNQSVDGSQQDFIKSKILDYIKTVVMETEIIEQKRTVTETITSEVEQIEIS